MKDQVGPLMNTRLPTYLNVGIPAVDIGLGLSDSSASFFN